LRVKALKTTKSRALEGRRVVITRAPEQAEELAHSLAELGAEVILLPLVRFVDPPDTSELDACIEALERFDWLIFTSANAVRFFFRRCQAVGRRPSAGLLRIAAVGPATRKALEAESLQASFVPEQFSGAALAAELSGRLAGKRVLMPRSDRGEDGLPRALRKASAIVTEVVAYCTAEPESLDAQRIGAIRRGEADAITFFSPSAFHAFERAVGSDGLVEINSRVIFAAVGPTTAAAIQRAGLSVAVQAPEATTRSLVAALERHFANVLTREGRIA
jgi:uroporphyrinogen III methyltransferase/synthase